MTSTDDSQKTIEGPPPRPRWVVVLLILVAILALVLVATQLLGVEHGPGRHGSLEAPVDIVATSV